MIKIYHHIYPTKNGIEISHKQKERLFLKIKEKFDYIPNIVNRYQTELWTLKMIQDDCKNFDDETPILYIHTKGATKPTIEREQWREYMERELIDNYKFLAANAKTLIGHKVMLRKGFIPGFEGARARYEICLQDGRHPGRLLGAMNQSLVYDLLNVLHPHGRGLPRTIMNLRISRVVSIPVNPNGENNICPTFSASQMCLGIELFGTGDFQTFGAKK